MEMKKYIFKIKNFIFIFFYYISYYYFLFFKLKINYKYYFFQKTEYDFFQEDEELKVNTIKLNKFLILQKRLNYLEFKVTSLYSSTQDLGEIKTKLKNHDDNLILNNTSIDESKNIYQIFLFLYSF